MRKSEVPPVFTALFWGAILVLLLFSVRAFVYAPFSIPSGSMEPTLKAGDYLFVAKYSYGFSRYNLPGPLASFIGNGRVLSHLPQRGDVVVFRLPSDPSLDFIKRVVGLPGDRVQLRKGVLYINDQPCKRERVSENNGIYLFRDAAGSAFAMSQYWETLPNGVRHRIAVLGDEREVENTPVYIVPPEHYFMLGDARDTSADSRVATSGVGFVPADNLVGRADLIFFSADWARVLTRIL